MIKELLEKYNKIALINCPAKMTEQLLFSEQIYWNYCYSYGECCKNPEIELNSNFDERTINVVFYIVDKLYWDGKPSNITKNNILGWDWMDDYIQYRNQLDLEKYEIIDFIPILRKLKLKEL